MNREEVIDILEMAASGLRASTDIERERKRAEVRGWCDVYKSISERRPKVRAGAYTSALDYRNIQSGELIRLWQHEWEWVGAKIGPAIDTGLITRDEFYAWTGEKPPR